MRKRLIRHLERLRDSAEELSHKGEILVTVGIKEKGKSWNWSAKPVWISKTGIVGSGLWNSEVSAIVVENTQGHKFSYRKAEA